MIINHDQMQASICRHVLSAASRRRQGQAARGPGHERRTRAGRPGSRSRSGRAGWTMKRFQLLLVSVSFHGPARQWEPRWPDGLGGPPAPRPGWTWVRGRPGWGVPIELSHHAFCATPTRNSLLLTTAPRVDSQQGRPARGCGVSAVGVPARPQRRLAPPPRRDKERANWRARQAPN